MQSVNYELKNNHELRFIFYKSRQCIDENLKKRLTHDIKLYIYKNIDEYISIVFNEVYDKDQK